LKIKSAAGKFDMGYLAFFQVSSLNIEVRMGRDQEATIENFIIQTKVLNLVLIINVSACFISEFLFLVTG
jgi:hypothetical protein